MIQRKGNRIKGFDYSQSGVYFLTACTENRVHWFGKVENKKMILNEFGQITEERIKWLELQYPYFKIHNYIVMPNHVHILCQIQNPYPIHQNTVGTGRDLSENEYQNVGTNRDLSENENQNVGINRDLSENENQNVGINRDLSENENQNVGTNRDLSENENQNVGTNRDLSENQRTGHEKRTGHDLSLRDENVESMRTSLEKRTGHDLSLRVKIKSISELMGAFKTTSSKHIHLAGNHSFQWQRSFYDNIIRTDKMFYLVNNYIDENPMRWEEDRFYNNDL